MFDVYEIIRVKSPCRCKRRCDAGYTKVEEGHPSLHAAIAAAHRRGPGSYLVCDEGGNRARLTVYPAVRRFRILERLPVLA